MVILSLTICHWPDDPFQDGLRNKNSLTDYKLKGYINRVELFCKEPYIVFLKKKVEAVFIGYNIGGL